ncbi:hypothetical protein C4F17_24850 [Variovorax sp. PMC12]|nr:hypothetical protein C4F17_24850 [Variovorax sp. PMC12]
MPQRWRGGGGESRHRTRREARVGTLGRPDPSARRDIGAPPGFAHFVSLRQPPRRGRHQRPGKAGSAVSLEQTLSHGTMAFFAVPP